MKNLFYLLFAILFFVGCSYKNEAIKLSSYEVNYAGDIPKTKSTVYLHIVKDMRKNKKSIGYVLKDSQKSVEFFSNVDFAYKYKQGLNSALKSAGFKIVDKADKASMIMDVYIKEIELVKNDKSFDENLKGKIQIEVVVKQGLKIIKQNFKQEAGKWIKPLYSSADLEPFLYELFSESINNIVSRLAVYAH